MADRVEIVDALESLAVHCRPPLMSVEDKSRWMASWCEDLAPYPVESIQIACKRWRMGEDRRFPMPGDLVRLVKSVTLQGDRGGDSRNGAELRGPVTDAEYDAMTLREKIRHQELLCMEAGSKAGPQWALGKPCPASDMPPVWHQWRERAANHGREAKRLREVLKGHRHAAE